MASLLQPETLSAELGGSWDFCGFLIWLEMAGVGQAKWSVSIADEISHPDFGVAFPAEFQAVEFGDLLGVEAVGFKQRSQSQDAVFFATYAGETCWACSVGGHQCRELLTDHFFIPLHLQAHRVICFRNLMSSWISRPPNST